MWNLRRLAILVVVAVVIAAIYDVGPFGEESRESPTPTPDIPQFAEGEAIALAKGSIPDHSICSWARAPERRGRESRWNDYYLGNGAWQVAYDWGRYYTLEGAAGLLDAKAMYNDGRFDPDAKFLAHENGRISFLVYETTQTAENQYFLEGWHSLQCAVELDSQVGEVFWEAQSRG